MSHPVATDHQHAARLAEPFQSLPFEQAHVALLDLLQTGRAS